MPALEGVNGSTHRPRTGSEGGPLDAGMPGAAHPVPDTPRRAEGQFIRRGFSGPRIAVILGIGVIHSISAGVCRESARSGPRAFGGVALSKIRGNAEGVLDWSGRDPWRERMGETVEKHLRKACDLNGLDIDDLPGVIGDGPAMAAVSCAFEDCFAKVWEDGSNLCTDYLKRRGWKESVVNRAYIEALRDSVMSLHEVSDIRPGESFLARDLLRGGEAVRVLERTATKSLVDWDIIAARIVTVRGEVQMTGGVLPVRRDLAEEMIALIARAQGRAGEAAASTLGSLGAADAALQTRLEGELSKVENLLRAGAATITTLWLDDALRRCLAPPPQLANTDGEPIEFMALHYRLKPKVSAARIAEALSGIADLRAEDDGAQWTWFGPAEPTSKGRRRKGGDDSDTGRTIHGSLALEGKLLKVTVNSDARAARIRSLLDPVLDGLAREPLIERTTPEQAMAEARRTAAPPSPGGAEVLSPEDMRSAVHQFLDRHYRNTLSQPIPALGGKSPRQAVRSARGRTAVASWLKGLEQNKARLPADDPMRGYGFGWMWEELGVADLRS